MEPAASRAVVAELPGDVERLSVRAAVSNLDVMVIHLAVHQAGVDSLCTDAYTHGARTQYSTQLLGAISKSMHGFVCISVGECVCVCARAKYCIIS